MSSWRDATLLARRMWWVTYVAPWSVKDADRRRWQTHSKWNNTGSYTVYRRASNNTANRWSVYTDRLINWLNDLLSRSASRFLFSVSQYRLRGCILPWFIILWIPAFYKSFACLLIFLLLYLRPYSFTSLLIYFLQNRPVHFPGQRS